MKKGIEMFVRHTNKEVKYAAGYVNLVLKGETLSR